MSAVAAASRARGLPPWDCAAPSLAALAASEVSPEELAWYAALLSLEDGWASAVGATEPDRSEVTIPLRELGTQFWTHVRADTPAFPLDDLQRATAFLQEPLRSILGDPNTRLARAHEPMPWARVEELDSRCLTWLMRLPGRSVREKAATTRRTLGVTRRRSVDVAENRIAIAVAQDLAPLIELRIERSSSAAHPMDEQREQQLTNVLHMIRSALPTSPLAGLHRPLRAEPNNALLGSGRYGRIWRVYRFLTKRTDDFELRWQLGPRLVAATLAMSLWGRLALRRDAFVPQDYARVHLSGLACGLTNVSTLDVILPAARPLRIAIAPANGTTSFSISMSDALSGEPLRRWTVDVEIERACGSAGTPSVSVLVRADHGAVALFGGHATSSSLFELAEEMLSPLDLPADQPAVIQIAGTPKLCLSTEPLRSLGLDLAAPCPVLVEPGNSPRLGEPCILVELALAPDERERLTGSAAIALQPDRAVQHRFALPSSWATLASGEAPLVDIAAALGRLLPAHAIAPGAEVCLPVPDALGEPGEALLRAALPVHVPRTWFIPRAVAAALALRAAQPQAVELDDSLLVLDWGPLGFEARLLLLRDDTSGSSAVDPKLWECPVPWEPVEGAAAYSSRAHWLELARAALPAGAPDSYVERLVDSGLVAELGTCALGTSGAALFGRRGQLGPLACITSDTVDAAVARATQHFTAWLEGLRDAKVFHNLAEQAGGRRLHVILVGDPLEMPRIASSLRECCAQLLPPAVLHQAGVALIARGAAEFMRRIRQRLPTFELALPDLYLRVLGADGKQTLMPIFEKCLVRPGSEVRVPPLSFELPPRTRIALPLRRDPDGRRPMAYSAILDEQLTAALPVELHVIYRYSEDGFRILIRPRERPGHEPPFREREIRWVRSSPETLQRQLVDEPPSFTDPITPVSPPSTAAVQPYLKTITLFHDRATQFLAEYAQTGNPAGWQKFEDQLITADKSMAALLRLAPLSVLPASARAHLVNKWLAVLCQLADLRPAPHEPEKTKAAWVSKLPSLRKHTARPGELAERGLSRLRHEAPTDLALRLFRRVCEKDEVTRDRLMNLGRVMGALPAADRARNFRALVIVATKERRSSVEQFAALWCLATAMWTDRQLVYHLEEAQAQLLLSFLGSILRSLNDDIGLYHEAAIVLFALLRLRGTPLHQLVAAGSRPLCELADRIEEIDRRLVIGGKRREPRLTIGDQAPPHTDMSRFADALCAALRGERIALIRTLEDSA